MILLTDFCEHKNVDEIIEKYKCQLCGKESQTPFGSKIIKGHTFSFTEKDLKRLLTAAWVNGHNWNKIGKVDYFDEVIERLKK